MSAPTDSKIWCGDQVYLLSAAMLALAIRPAPGSYEPDLHGDPQKSPSGDAQADDPALSDPGRFGDAIGKIGPAVFQVGGHPRQEDTGTVIHGTAFLISRKHRLLATVAHLPDIFPECDGLMAIPNGTSNTFRVDRIWYHPYVLRRFDVGLYAPSMNPRDGEMVFPTVDVAILHLAEGGPELPAECELAKDEELNKLVGQAVCHMGFPGRNGAGWPDSSQRATANLTAGVITRQVAYDQTRAEDPSASTGEKRWLRATAWLGQGASGGPLFLDNGHVVGLYSGSWCMGNGVQFQEFVRIDYVREIILYHNIGGRREGRCHREFELHLDRMRRAVSLVREAGALCARGQYRMAGEQCNEAIRLVPNYAWAYLRRGEVYLFYCATHWGTLTDEIRRRYAAFGRDDLSRCIQLLPDENMYRCDDFMVKWHHRPTLLQTYANLYFGLAFRRTGIIQRNIEYLSELIDKPLSPLGEVRTAELVNCRAHCRLALGDFEGSRKDFDEAIRLAPRVPRWYLDRAQFWGRRSRPDLMAKDNLTAERLLRVKASTL